MSYGSETDANALFTALTTDDTVDIPAVDLTAADFQIPGGIDAPWYHPVARLTNADLTTKEINGTGTFDVLMAGYSSQLREEYNKNRITGAEYTKAFVAMGQAAMEFSVQFLLGRDQSFWLGVQAQIAAITAKVQLETAKVQYAALRLEALTSKANYALTKLKLSSEDVAFGAAKYNLDNLLPQQLAIAIQQVLQSQAQVLQIREQTILTQKQEGLVTQQTEAAHAQISDTLLDGMTAVGGSIGEQSALYAQQIESYKRDAENKAAKIFSDAWITMYTINDSVPVPGAFTNANLDIMLNQLAANNNFPPLVTAPVAVGSDPLDPTNA